MERLATLQLERLSQALTHLECNIRDQFPPLSLFAKI